MEELSKLPNGWVWTKIDEIKKSMKNGIYKPAQFYTDDGFACLRMYNIENGSIVWKDIKRMNLTLEEIEDYKLLQGDILVNRVNSRELVGKAAVIPFGLETCIYESKNIRLRLCDDFVDSRFVNFWFRLFSQQYFNRNAQQTVGMASINQEQLAMMPIPFTPLFEQKRIVAKIEELFTNLDDGVELLKKIKAQLKRYRQAVLKHAFEGKLTKEWREANKDKLEPASILLERIREEREAIKQTSGRKVKKNSSTDKANIVTPGSNLLEDWHWVRLGEVADKITDGEHFRPKTVDSGVYFLSAKDIRDNGVSFEAPLFISEDTANKARQRCKPERDDILIVSRGATVGRLCIVNTNKNFCLLGSVILIKVNKNIDNAYLAHILKSPFINQKMISISGATAQQAIYLRDIQNIQIPLCSYSEQQTIIKEIESHLSIADKLEETIENSLKQSERLRQSILKRAFEGKLVPQDPSDEPAEKLLERIKAEKIKPKNSKYKEFKLNG